MYKSVHLFRYTSFIIIHILEIFYAYRALFQILTFNTSLDDYNFDKLINFDVLETKVYLFDKKNH